MPSTTPSAVVISGRGERDEQRGAQAVDHPDEDVPAEPRLQAEPVLAGDAAGVAQRHAVAVELVLELLLRADAVQPARSAARPAPSSDEERPARTPLTMAVRSRRSRAQASWPGERPTTPGAARPAPRSRPAGQTLDLRQAHDGTSATLAAATRRRHGSTASLRPCWPTGRLPPGSGRPPAARRRRGRPAPAPRWRRCPAPSSSGCGTGSPTAGSSGVGTSPVSRIRARPGRAAVTSGTADSSARVYGCCGPLVDVGPVADLDDLAQVHHRDPLAEVPHHGQVVGDEHERQAQLPLQVAQQVDDLRLDRDVQRGDRLVGDDQLRAAARAPGRCRCAGAGRRRTRAGSGCSAPGSARPAPAAPAPAPCTPPGGLMPLTCSGIATIRPTVCRGFSEAYGSWKMICRSWRSGRSARRPACVMSRPSNTILPAVGSSSRTSIRPVVVLPQPDSPTRPSVSPGAHVEVEPVDRPHQRRWRRSPCAYREVLGQPAHLQQRLAARGSSARHRALRLRRHAPPPRVRCPRRRSRPARSGRWQATRWPSARGRQQLAAPRCASGSPAAIGVRGSAGGTRSPTAG